MSKQENLTLEQQKIKSNSILSRIGDFSIALLNTLKDENPEDIVKSLQKQRQEVNNIIKKQTENLKKSA